MLVALTENGSHATTIVLSILPNESERLFGPAVLLHDLGFFLGSEIILYVKELADLLHTLTLDHRGDFSA